MIPNSTVAVGVQDGSFEAFQRGLDNPIQHTCLCCTCLQGFELNDLKLVPITVDGLDASVNIVNILREWSPDVVFLGGATFAGFNVVDVEQVHETLGVPVIVYMKQYPDMEATLGALRKHFPDWKERWSRYEALGDIQRIEFPDYPPAYFEVIGTSVENAEKFIRGSIKEDRNPEPLRLANLIAKGTSSIFQDQAGTLHGS